MSKEDNKDIYSELSKAIIKCYKQVDAGMALGNAFEVDWHPDVEQSLVVWIYVERGRTILLELCSRNSKVLYCQVEMELIEFGDSKAFWRIHVLDGVKGKTDVMVAKSLTEKVLKPMLMCISEEKYIRYFIKYCDKFNRKVGV